MANGHAVGEAIRDDKGLQVTGAEVSVPEVGAFVWRRPQGVACGDVDEGERWDGLS